MGNIFFVSDTHWGHNNVINYSDRPYSSVDEMTEGLIDNWNNRVTKQDQVFHLGDFSLQNRYVPMILPRLNFRELHLLCGNHDRAWDAVTKPHKVNQLRWLQQYLDWGFTSVKLHDTMKVGKYEVNLAHLPYRGAGDHTESERFTNQRLEDDGKILLHGHLHSSKEEKIRRTKKGTLMIDVGVDGNVMKPYSIEEIEELISECI